LKVKVCLGYNFNLSRQKKPGRNELGQITDYAGYVNTILIVCQLLKEGEF